MELLRGSVNDRAWGLTLAAFAQRRTTGELSVATPHGHIRVAFRDGNVVGAMSPVSSDSAVRVGVQLNLIISSAVQDLIRRVTASPSRDEVDVIAEVIRLPADQLRKLRRRVVAVRAARTFAFEHAAYAVSNEITLPVSAGNELDTRAVIYLGARMHATAERMASDLRLLGMRVTFTPELEEDLVQFGFGALEQPILDGLRAGRTLAEVVAANPEIDLRLAQAVTYALATWTSPPSAVMPRAISASEAPMLDLDAPDQPQAQQDIGAGTSVSFRARTGSNPPSASQSGSFPARSPSNPTNPVPASHTIPPPRSSSSPGIPTRPVSASTPPVGTPRVPASASTPPLGVPRTTTRPSSPPVRPTPVPSLSSPAVARTISALGVKPSGTGSGIPATGSSPRLTRQSGQHPAIPPSASTSSPGIKTEKTPQELRAEALDARKRGEMALRREQLPQAIEEFNRAVNLDPKNGAAQALLAWAQFCAAPDKAAVANETRRTLATAALNTEEPVAKLYLGRVERMLGRDKEALRHFQEVLFEHPRNTEAASEVRVLESRLQNSSSKPFFKK